jgi:hypothetical protein
MAREGKVHGERQVSDKRSENAVYAGDQSRQEVHNAIFLRGKTVYKTCPTLGINSNSERCLNEIDTRVPNSMGSVYEATSHVILDCPYFLFSQPQRCDDLTYLYCSLPVCKHRGMFLEQTLSYLHETLPHRDCPLAYLYSSLLVCKHRVMFLEQTPSYNRKRTVKVCQIITALGL